MSFKMPYNKISEADKRRIVEAHDREEDYFEVARVLGVARTTAWAIIRRYQLHNEVIRPRGGRRNEAIKMDDDMRECLVNIVRDYPAFTLTQINAELRARLPAKPHVSVSSVVRALDGQLISSKKLEDVPAERNSVATKVARRAYAEWFLAEGVNSILVYVDEAGFNLFTRRTRGRAHVGERAIRQVGGCRGRNLTIIMAISPVGGLHYHELHVGSVNMAVFDAFLDNLGDVIGEDFRVTVVTDNAPIHNGARMEYEGQHTIRKLPPYSPMLNPIELAFSCLKAAVKRDLNHDMARILDRGAAAAAGLTLATYRINILREIVERNLHLITVEKCDNWYRHTMGYMRACMDNEDIFM